jgi:glycerate 2-kinase
MPDRDLAHPPPAQGATTTAVSSALLIPRSVLIASAAFGTELPAARVTTALARGLRAGGIEEADECPLEDGPLVGRALLEELGFDQRMLAARAVVIGAEQLQEQTLATSLTFEIATRARQSGVPAYAVTASNRLDGFDARILDLQTIIEAHSTRTLTAAGRRLALVI